MAEELLIPQNENLKAMKISSKKNILIWLGLLLVVIYIYWGRNIYCIGGNKCITVWKKFNNKSLVIPGRYFGMLKPSSCYIETENIGDIVVYWSDKLPEVIIIRCDGIYKIYYPGNIKILDYKKSYAYEKILYEIDSKKFNEVKPTSYLMDINIKENYAVDKFGEKISPYSFFP